MTVPATTNLTRSGGRPNAAAVARRVIETGREIEGCAFGATLLASEALNHDALADAHVAMIEGLALRALEATGLSNADRRLWRAILRECVGYWRADACEDSAVYEAREQTRLIAGLIEQAESGHPRIAVVEVAR